MVRYTNEFLISELRRVYTELGRTPTCDEIKNYNAPNKTTYTNRFGSYTTACELAGIPPIRARRNTTDLELLDYLKEMYKMMKRPLSTNDFNEHSKYHIDTISKRFGGFCTACRLAGVPSVSHYGVTNEEMLIDLKGLYEKLGRAPTIQELPIYGLPSAVLYRERFGSYTNALYKIEVEDINHTSGNFRGVRCFAKDGTICNSLAELLITNYLIDAKITFDKEVQYPGSKYRTDWVVDGVFIEYFGLAGKEFYDKKIEIKRNICNSRGIKLVEIYPHDLKNLDSIFKSIRPNVKS